MKSTKILFVSLMLLLALLSGSALFAQSTAVTDSDSYTAHSSAMLDVYSLSKGLLVPRLTAAQRVAIATPADGLLVYDTDADHYYYFANSTWNPIDAPSLWSENNDTIFITGDGKRYGVGTASPVAKLTVQGDASIAPDEPLFEVKNSAGDVIFAVYENEVKVNFKESTKGVKGGFAVGGLSGTKSEPVEYMRITPDSVRIYIDDSGTKGVKGGFAVGGLSGTKGGNQYFKLDEESASIYLKQPAKGVKGGFAVGGLSGTKGAQDFLTIARDSARIYIDDAAKGVKGGFAVGGLSGTKGGNQYFKLDDESASINLKQPAKGVKGGFAVGGLSGTKGDTTNFLNVTTQNYFIGHNVASNINDGVRNSVFGYKAGYSLGGGDDNVLIGNKAGYSLGAGSIGGNENVFIGNEAGYSALGPVRNVFIGHQAGYANKSGQYNVYLGNGAGRNSTSGGNTILGGLAASTNDIGSSNVIIGYVAGRDMVSARNVMIGQGAGYNNSSADGHNVFIGYQAGANATVATEGYRLVVGMSSSQHLIYGEFDNNRVAINGRDPHGKTFYVNGTAGGLGAWGTKADLNAKSNIQNISGALDKVLKLEGVSFLWKDESEMGRQLGLNGQDVKEIIPEVVGDAESGYAIQYGALTPLLIEAVKEQQQQIEELKKSNDELKELINKLLNQK